MNKNPVSVDEVILCEFLTKVVGKKTVAKGGLKKSKKLGLILRVKLKLFNAVLKIFSGF